MQTRDARFLRLITAAAAFALAAAGCSSSPNGIATAPSVASSADARPGSTVRFYTAAISPTTLAAGSGPTSVSVTIVNCDGSGACAGSATTSTQTVKSATVAVPAGFTASGPFTAAGPAGKTWHATFSAGLVTAEADQGNFGLDPGQSVTITFNVTAPANCGSFEFTSIAFNDNTTQTTPYVLKGTQPAITVTGCVQAGTCTLSQGFWKNTPTAWPVTSLTLGTVNYSQTDLISILEAPVVGNGLIALAHQLIAAKLNVANGATADSAVQAAIASADVLIGSLVVPPVGSGSLDPSATSTLVTALDSGFNTGANHCSGDSSGGA